MKTKILFLSLTKVFIVLSICCFFSSCDSTPIIDSKNPFVVNQINEIGDDMSEYYGGNSARWGANPLSGRPSIVLPSRIYNIGDTVSLVNFKSKYK